MTRFREEVYGSKAHKAWIKGQRTFCCEACQKAAARADVRVEYFRVASEGRYSGRKAEARKHQKATQGRLLDG